MFRAWYESMIPSSPTDNLELREGSNEEEEDDIQPEEDDIHSEEDEQDKAEQEEDGESDETASVRRDSEEEEEEEPRQRLSGGSSFPVTWPWGWELLSAGEVLIWWYFFCPFSVGYCIGGIINLISK